MSKRQQRKTRIELVSLSPSPKKLKNGMVRSKKVCHASRVTLAKPPKLSSLLCKVGSEAVHVRCSCGVNARRTVDAAVTVARGPCVSFGGKTGERVELKTKQGPTMTRA